MNVTSTYISHVPNYPVSCSTPYIGNILLFSTKPQYIMGRLVHICNGCKSPCKWFVYHCALCKFDLDIKCVSQSLSIKTEIHEHPLNLFGKKILLTCDFCGKEGKNMPYLCGNSCGFWVHHKCASLPRIVKHIQHKQSLNLTCSLINIP